MFEITPLTAFSGGECELSYDEQVELLRHIRNYIGDNLPTYSFRDYAGWELGGKLLEKFLPLELVNKEGKLTKRVSKWIKSTYGYEMDSSQLSALGSVIASFQVGDFSYDVTDEFDWNAGDFGDRNSCFWGGREEARVMIRDGGGVAIRFYDEDGDGNGRAWVMPKGDDWVIFNAYGPTLEMVAERVELIYPGCVTRKVALTNWGSAVETLWINNECGTLVSLVDRKIHRIDLGAGDEDGGTCECCENHFTGDGYYVRDSYGGEISVCCRCYENEYSRCDDCGDCHSNDYVYSIEQRYKRGSVWFEIGKTLCSDCYDNYSECDDCEHHINALSYNLTEVTKHGYNRDVCPVCLKNNYHKCEECGEYGENGEECECVEEKEEESYSYALTGVVANRPLPLWMEAAEMVRYREFGSYTLDWNQERGMYMYRLLEDMLVAA